MLFRQQRDVPSTVLRRDASRVASAISVEISEYSTTWGLPPTEASTPTFSCGSACIRGGLLVAAGNCERNYCAAIRRLLRDGTIVAREGRQSEH